MQVGSEEEQYQRGVVLQKARRYAEAAAVYQDLAARQLTVKVAANLGFCLGELGDFAEAARYLGLAADHSPREPTLHRLAGAAFVEAGDFDRAERELKIAQALAPQDAIVQLALANLYLVTGRYAEGWPLLDVRAAAHGHVVPAVNLPYPEWRGEPLAGKSILVWVEQGFGDKIQMARFMAGLKARGAAKVTLGCNPPLAHLFSTLAGVDALVTVEARQSVQVPVHDYWSRYFSVPQHLGITLENLPAEPYLTAPADRREPWADYRAGASVDGRRVGLAWQASPTGFNAANKGLTPEEAGRLIDLGAISLDPADTGVGDFADTAAIIETLDLVVSIDSAVAHLAGAMGKPCWTLLPYIHCDWRWLRGRSDSPWYPSMRLYRQTRPRDWTGTLDRVIADLAAAELPPA